MVSVDVLVPYVFTQFRWQTAALRLLFSKPRPIALLDLQAGTLLTPAIPGTKCRTGLALMASVDVRPRVSFPVRLNVHSTPPLSAWLLGAKKESGLALKKDWCAQYVGSSCPLSLDLLLAFMGFVWMEKRSIISAYIFGLQLSASYQRHSNVMNTKLSAVAVGPTKIR